MENFISAPKNKIKTEKKFIKNKIKKRQQKVCTKIVVRISFAFFNSNRNVS